MILSTLLTISATPFNISIKTSTHLCQTFPHIYAKRFKPKAKQWIASHYDLSTIFLWDLIKAFKKELVFRFIVWVLIRLAHTYVDLSNQKYLSFITRGTLSYKNITRELFIGHRKLLFSCELTNVYHVNQGQGKVFIHFGWLSASCVLLSTN